MNHVSRALTDDERAVLDQAADYLDESAESMPGSSEGEGRKASAHVCREMSRMTTTPLTDLERAELIMLRYTRAEHLCSPQDQQVLGPMSLWSEAGLIAHVASRVRMSEQKYHDALQRVGTALGLHVGSDVTVAIVPAIEALKIIASGIGLEELHDLLYTAQRTVGEPREEAINKARLVLHKMRESIGDPTSSAKPMMPELKTIIENLRVTHGATTPGRWQRGDTSHQTVSVHDINKPPYRIADFHHADDASFCDLAHRHIIEVLDALEGKGDAS